MPTVHLVDASPYIFRAYFSIPASLRAPDGRPVNAVRGFTWFLLELLEREGVSHAAVAFDESLTTSFRNELYPAYKAQRELPPSELEAQLRDCRAVATAFPPFGIISSTDKPSFCPRNSSGGRNAPPPSVHVAFADDGS